MTNPIPNNRGNKIALLLLGSVLFTTRITQAQCIASGPMSPAASASVPYAGSNYSFSNPSNVLVDDNNRATASSFIGLLGGQTQYLQASDFGFSIPTAATICGIEVTVEKSATNVNLLLGSWVKDLNVRILKNGVLTGNNLADISTVWSGTDSYTTYGNNNELWGASWSPADINSNNFGISFSAQLQGLITLLPSARINYISMTVYYLDPSVLAVHTMPFEVTTGANHTAALSWKPGNKEEATSFMVERSNDGKQWEPLSETPQKNTITQLYTLTDTRPLAGHSFYRIKIALPSGQVYYSTVRSFEITDNMALRCYPNPFTASIQVSGITAGERVTVTNIYGQQVYLSPPATSNTVSIDANDLQPGIYVIGAGDRKMKVQKK
jgi:hypothetical protein